LTPQVRIQQGLKDQPTDLAKHEHRSLNQQIEFLLEEPLSEAGRKPQNDQHEGKGAVMENPKHSDNTLHIFDFGRPSYVTWPNLARTRL
jgi:hypothetical protein